MSRQFGVVFSLFVCLAFNHAKASEVAKKSAEIAEKSGVEPEVEGSDKKFFGKDFPWDKRPKVDVFHFKHPYPVVQDSDDFDKDFIKDENSDNGAWKAQTEYDRLRHKLLEGKEKVAKGLRAKTEAEKELQEAMRRMHAAQEAIPTHAPSRPHVAGSRGEAIHIKIPAKKEEPPRSSPGGIASPGDVKIATTDTQRAMDALEECKKELARARENLKKLMDELEEAKKEQKKTQAAYEAAAAREKDSESENEKGKTTVKSTYQQYMDAREEFLRQQALVAKMEVDIKVAASKVKEIRDGEDGHGGVYNTGAHKSDSRSFAQPLLALALIVSMTY